MSKFIVSRAINGVTINGKEYLLDDDGKLLSFDSEEKAVSFMRENGVPDDAYEVEEEDAV